MLYVLAQTLRANSMGLVGSHEGLTLKKSTFIETFSLQINSTIIHKSAIDVYSQHQSHGTDWRTMLYIFNLMCQISVTIRFAIGSSLIFSQSLLTI